MNVAATSREIMRRWFVVVTTWIQVPSPLGGYQVWLSLLIYENRAIDSIPFVVRFNQKFIQLIRLLRRLSRIYSKCSSTFTHISCRAYACVYLYKDCSGYKVTEEIAQWVGYISCSHLDLGLILITSYSHPSPNRNDS